EPRRKVLYSTVEHHAVMNTARALAEEGWPVETVRVGEDGALDLHDLEAKLDEHTALVAVMLANNETGVVQPLAGVVRLAHARGALVHVHVRHAQGPRRGAPSPSTPPRACARSCAAARRSATGAPAPRASPPSSAWDGPPSWPGWRCPRRGRGGARCATASSG